MTSTPNFCENEAIGHEICHAFGSHVLDYISNIAATKSSLQSLSQRLFLAIIKYLAARDVVQLSQSSKILFGVSSYLTPIYSAKSP